MLQSATFFSVSFLFFADAEGGGRQRTKGVETAP